MSSASSNDTFSAFTVSELGEMLPEDYGVFQNRLNDYLYFRRTTRSVNGEIGLEQWNLEVLGQENTEADARAKMLIYLLENGLIKC